jgi:hypothetical protein
MKCMPVWRGKVFQGSERILPLSGPDANAAFGSYTAVFISDNSLPQIRATADN